MVRLQRISTADVELYGFMESLIVEAFPPEEYRDTAELRVLTDSEERFHNNVVYDGDRTVGLITYWDFGRFIYVEHFAIAPSVRNGGYGRKVLELLKNESEMPVVLEVEMPDNETARRRIGFYERQGFAVLPDDYRQPPYRHGGDCIPMRLMAYGRPEKGMDFGLIESVIHREVYGVGKDMEY